MATYVLNIGDCNVFECIDMGFDTFDMCITDKSIFEGNSPKVGDVIEFIDEDCEGKGFILLPKMRFMVISIYEQNPDDITIQRIPFDPIVRNLQSINSNTTKKVFRY